MKCGHCLIEFFPTDEIFLLGEDSEGSWAVIKNVCPSCKKFNLDLVKGTVGLKEKKPIIVKTIFRSTFRPKNGSRPPCPREVPTTISEDYNEACIVLVDSPKASAALSRRCLQNLLREAAKAKKSNLFNEIQEVLDSNTLPSHLSRAIDAIRNIGNFAAHPEKSKITGQIVPIEPEEAEWNLEVLESLFDFYYVQPTLSANKIASLNKKLTEAGKTAMR